MSVAGAVRALNRAYEKGIIMYARTENDYMPSAGVFYPHPKIDQFVEFNFTIKDKEKIALSYSSLPLYLTQENIIKSSMIVGIDKWIKNYMSEDNPTVIQNSKREVVVDMNMHFNSFLNSKGISKNELLSRLNRVEKKSGITIKDELFKAKPKKSRFFLVEQFRIISERYLKIKKRVMDLLKNYDLIKKDSSIKREIGRDNAPH